MLWNRPSSAKLRVLIAFLRERGRSKESHASESLISVSVHVGSYLIMGAGGFTLNADVAMLKPLPQLFRMAPAVAVKAH